MDKFDEAEAQRKQDIKHYFLISVFFFTFAISSFVVALVIDKIYPIFIAMVWLYCGWSALRHMKRLTK
jgi:hypothetical protein